MKKLNIILVFTFVILVSPIALFAQKEFKKSFGAKQTLKISTSSGNCTIAQSNDNKINVKLIYTFPDDCFKYKIDESTEYLSITEDFRGNCSGKSDWTIEVPSNTEVEFNSASGDYVITGTGKGVSGNTASGNIGLEQISGEVKLNTASGDVKLNKINGDVNVNTASGNLHMESVSGKAKVTTASGDVAVRNCNTEIKISVASGNIGIQDCNGLIDLNTASGDIKIAEVKGTLKLNAASGNVEANSVEISGASNFNTASGNVTVKLAKTSEHDLNLSTASGDVELNYSGNEVKGYFEFTARQDKGEIVSPIKFDKQEVIEMDGKKYDKKSFTKGSSSPVVKLKTSSGTVQLVK